MNVEFVFVYYCQLTPSLGATENFPMNIEMNIHSILEAIVVKHFLQYWTLPNRAPSPLKDLALHVI